MNPKEFQNRISTNPKPLVIDFWAPWCTPCKLTKPVLERLAKEFSEEVEFLAINGDQSQDLLRSLNIYGIPTVIAYRHGKEAARVVGAQPEASYRGVFANLAQGKEVKVPLTPLNRMIRLGLGALIVMIGISNGNWFLTGLGALFAFMGIYDRCPIWNAITRYFKGEQKNI
jgi:thioredoxin 1